MPTEQHFREQAELCFEIARYMSNPAAAEHARLAAVEYLRRADELQKQKGVTKSVVAITIN